LPFNSSGVFSRLYNWVTDRSNNVKISASRMDAEFDGIATALSQCVLKDGTQTVTAALPMNNNKITGLGAATTTTDAVQMDQVAKGVGDWYGNAGGTGDAITLSALGWTPSALTNGMRVRFRATAANTGATTLAVGALSAKSVVDAAGNALISGQIASGQLIEVVYGSTSDHYRIVSDISIPNAFIDVASATTTDIGAVRSENVRVTGTTTITGFGTVAAGTIRNVRFEGALTLTHNGTSLILPGAVNITTAANDSCRAVSLGSGNWYVSDYQVASYAAIGSGLNAASGVLGINTNNSLGVGSYALLQNISGSPVGNGSTLANTALNLVDIATSGFTATSSPAAGTWRNVNGASVANNGIGMFIRTA
jgi:hypothetical protein